MMDYLRTTFSSAFLICVIQGFDLPNASSRTCVIGAGYSGLATAKHLKKYNLTFTVFDASKYLGGIWHFDPRVGMDDGGIPIISKMYRNLKLNTPYQFTEFDDFPFPEGTDSHLPSECIDKYLTSFATKFGLLPHIQFRRLVTSVKRYENQWQLTYWRGDTRESVSEFCDYVVIAIGMYNDPVWPKIQGEDKFQGTISHSHTYRGDTKFYSNRRVLIVGAGASGLDISTQISKVASKLIHSYNRAINLPVHAESYVRKPNTKSFTHNGAFFEDGSFEEVDDVIYCTGYRNWYSLLDDSSGLITNGKFLLPLYRKIVNIKHPSMLFVGAITFAIHKVSDAQGNYAASLIAGRFKLPSEDKMMKNWIEEVNLEKNIEFINSVKENMIPYCANLSQEANIPPLPPVYNSILKYIDVLLLNDFSHSKQYNWRIIDDYNFDLVYVGTKEIKCPI